MIYEIENKPYMQVENRYVEVVVAKDGDIKPAPKFHKIYCEDVSKDKIKEYTVEQYIKKISTHSKLTAENTTKETY